MASPEGEFIVSSLPWRYIKSGRMRVSLWVIRCRSLYHSIYIRDLCFRHALLLVVEAALNSEEGIAGSILQEM